MELVKHGDVNQPDAELTKALVSRAAGKGLMLLSCGVRSNVIRILTPLTIPMEHLDEGMGILQEQFEALVS
jgi:4-aminobutyrate aminotransferase/(S)-3-amino-2-methylpropionate transaminase